jgi:hypothetical protein
MPTVKTKDSRLERDSRQLIASGRVGSVPQLILATYGSMILPRDSRPKDQVTVRPLHRRKVRRAKVRQVLRFV